MGMLDKVKGSIPFMHKEEQTNSEKTEETTENTNATEQDMLGEILKKLTSMTEGFTQKLNEHATKLKEMEGMMTDLKEKQKNNEGDQELKERVDRIDKTLEEFSGMYELISKQYNPFLNKDDNKQEPQQATQQTPPPTQQQSHVIIEDKITGSTSQIHQGQQHKQKHEAKKQHQEKKTKEEPADQEKIMNEIKEMNQVSDDLQKELIQTMIEEKQKSKNLTKQVDEQHKFNTPECGPLTCLMDLVHALNNPKITVFEHHIKENEDHFADWIEHALQMKPLAEKLRIIKDKQQYIATILNEG